MKRCNWNGIPDCNRQLVFIKNAFPGEIAERAAINSEIEGFPHLPEISLVSIPLHRIAAVAQGLEIARVVAPTHVARDDMVHLQGSDVSRNPT
jgi:hypothetical protein